MKTATLILKILAGVATIVGIVYLVATYGDKVVAWFKRLLGNCTCGCECDCDECECDGNCEECDCDCCECDCEPECECECECECEEGEVVAPEADFEA